MNTPKIRFKGFKDDWEQRKLGDSCKLNGRIGFRGYTEDRKSTRLNSSH